MTRSNLARAIAALLCAAASLDAQPRTRAEQIEDMRDEKIANLWPERESPLVRQVNGLVERGLGDGLKSGKGANGPQIVVGGMRSGQGASFGVGYRRGDIWRERLGYRATVRGTVQLAYMMDFELDFQSLGTKTSFVRLYSKYESSPQMDYYGEGTDSSKDSRTSYALDDFSTDLDAGFQLFGKFEAGLTFGWVAVHNGTGSRSGVPSTDEVFTPETTPGLGMDTDFVRFGTFFAFDRRDSKAGARSGNFFGVRYRQYNDVALDQFGFKQSEFDVQQYFPFFNETRVLAFRLRGTLSFSAEDQEVPFYLQPTLGGNDDLRGFERYRFYDDNAIFASAEYRWHVFSGLEMALFADAGKVAHTKSDFDFSDLKYSGGLGFRVRLVDAVVTRIDFAYGREGFRWMWTFGDIYKVRQ
jgi:outer membrane protein assembly factor BamA